MTYEKSVLWATLEIHHLYSRESYVAQKSRRGKPIFIWPEHSRCLEYISHVRLRDVQNGRVLLWNHKKRKRTRQESSVIHLASSSAPPILDIISTWNLLFILLDFWDHGQNMCENYYHYTLARLVVGQVHQSFHV